MGALLQGAGADLVPSDNSGLLSGLTAPAGGAAAAQQPSNGLLASLAARGGLRNDDGTVSPLNPVQQVGLQGLLGSLGPTRGGQAAAGGASPSQPAPAAAQRAMQMAQQSAQQQPQQQQAPTPQPRPAEAPLGTPQMAYDWSGYRQQARQATEGTNQMPYTFSNFGGLMNGMKVEDIMKMFYPGYVPPGTETPAPQQPDYSGMSGIVYRGGEYG